MSIFKRLFALLLCITVICGCLASCGGNKPRADKYEASVRVAFATDDNKMKLAVGTMNSSSVIKADGDNISVVSSAEGGESSATHSYTLVGGTLYHLLSVQVGDNSVTRREKAEFSETYSYILLSDIGAGADIDRGDFGTVTESEYEGKDIYTCSDIIDDAKAGLLKSLSKKFAVIGASVEITNVSYILHSKDGLAVKETLSCDLEIALDGEIYKVTMRAYTDYDYEAEINITAPSDAGTYKEVSYEEIVG